MVTVQNWLSGFANKALQAYRAAQHDLSPASRADSIQMIRGRDERIADQARQLAAEAQEIAELRRTIAALTRQVGRLLAEGGGESGSSSGIAGGMPGLKTVQVTDAVSPTRERRVTGAGRRRMAPTRIDQHALRTRPGLVVREMGRQTDRVGARTANAGRPGRDPGPHRRERGNRVSYW